jgi:hypothetical protein
MTESESRDIPALYKGDLVAIADQYARPDDRGIVYEITRENPVNWQLAPINGGGRALRCRPEMLRKATADEIAAARASDPVVPVHPGTVVTVTGPGWSQPAETPWSVTRLNGAHLVEIARLGGDAGRSVARIPRAYLTPVSEEQLAAMIVATATA